MSWCFWAYTIVSSFWRVCNSSFLILSTNFLNLALIFLARLSLLSLRFAMIVLVMAYWLRCYSFVISSDNVLSACSPTMEQSEITLSIVSTLCSLWSPNNAQPEQIFLRWSIQTRSRGLSCRMQRLYSSSLFEDFRDIKVGGARKELLFRVFGYFFIMSRMMAVFIRKLWSLFLAHSTG